MTADKLDIIERRMEKLNDKYGENNWDSASTDWETYACELNDVIEYATGKSDIL